MSSDRSPRPQVLELAVLLPGGWLAAQVLQAMAQRVVHPFDLEWMEGGMLVHALRLSRGEPIYTLPTPDWIPYIYPPGYASLVALWSALGGEVDYLPARLLSVLGTLLACAALARLGALGGSLSAGVAGGIAFLLTYRASGAFFDMARPDGLAMAALGWTFVLALERRRGSAEAAGLLLAAAFAIKHHSAAFGLPLALALWARDGWRVGLRFGLCALIPALTFLGLLQWRTEGRFLDYLVRIPSSHPVDRGRVFPGIAVELGLWVLPAVVASSGWLLARARSPWLGVPTWAVRAIAVAVGCAVGGAAAASGDVPGIGVSDPWRTGLCGAALGAAAALGPVVAAVAWRGTDPALVFAWLAGAVGVVVVAAMRGHNGGFMNVLMPAHWLLCAGLVVAACQVARSWTGRAGPGLATLLVGTQVAWGGATVDLDPLVPTPEDVAAGRAVVDALSRCPAGPIFAPHAPWLVRQAGREPGLHLISLWDVSHPDGPFPRGADRVQAAARERRWACVLTNANGRVGYGVEAAYPRSESIPAPPRALTGKTGWRVRPTRILLPPAPVGEEAP